jgi:hypothetical protein
LPVFGHDETVHAHVVLECFRGTIIVPEFDTTVNVLTGLLPFTHDVTLESLSENRVELLDMVLQTHDVTVKGEHVIYSLFLERTDVDSLILLQLDQVSNLVVLFHGHFLCVCK